MPRLTGRPPSFEDARNRHQKVRAAGLDPHHWYAVEYADRVRPQQVVEVQFWGRSIAVYRGADRMVRALDDRCAQCHRPLSLGEVTDDALRCRCRRWTCGGDDSARSAPPAAPAPYPVRVRYGLIWLFPGDSGIADRRAMPEIPELEGPDPWAYVPIDFTWRAHHSMVMANLCDLTHAHLHRRFPSFLPGRLLSCESSGDRVVMRYEARVGPFAHRPWAEPRMLEIACEYPYHRARFQWSNIDGAIAYWTFLLPIGARSTRVFFVFCYDRLRAQFLPIGLGHRAVRALLWAIRPAVRRLLGQDGAALEAEQTGWDRHFAQSIPDLNPVIAPLERLTIEKWESYLRG